MMHGGWFGMSGPGLLWLFPVLIVVLVVVFAVWLFGKRASRGGR
jgi:cytochrome c-type biogenesis protein CcmH/NrfF